MQWPAHGARRLRCCGRCMQRSNTDPHLHWPHFSINKQSARVVGLLPVKPAICAKRDTHSINRSVFLLICHTHTAPLWRHSLPLTSAWRHLIVAVRQTCARQIVPIWFVSVCGSACTSRHCFDLHSTAHLSCLADTLSDRLGHPDLGLSRIHGAVDDSILHSTATFSPQTDVRASAPLAPSGE